MDVQPERVVAPDDVAQQLVVAPVVRRVDDPLLLPVRPRMRSRRAEEQTHRLDERPQLRAALRQRGGDIGERLLPAGADLHLRGDELAHEMGLERGPAGGGLDLLEAVREVERVGIEQRELLLDRDREVGRGLELRARLRDQLVRGEALFVTHGGATVVKVLATDRARGAGLRRSPSSSARRPRGVPIP